MADDLVRALRDRYDQISGVLERAQAPADLDAAKRDIIAFFKHVDGLVTELAALKEEIRALVDRYKQMAAESRGAAAPELPAEKPVVHADHIGASTYIQGIITLPGRTIILLQTARVLTSAERLALDARSAEPAHG